MQRYKKYLSAFLLLVFTWVLMPPALLHEVFADHHDTQCDLKHRHDIATVEPLHIHCSIFTTNAPIYDVPELVVVARPLRYLIAELGFNPDVSYHQALHYTLPARAPPTV